MDDSARFRGAYDYARRKGYAGGYPNMFEAVHDELVYGTVLLPSSTVEWRDMTSAELQGATLANFPELARRVNAWARPERGYEGGFPNGYVATYPDKGLVHGAVLFRVGQVEWRDVPATEPGHPDVNNVGNIMRAGAKYAGDRGLPGAMPTFFEGQSGGQRVCGLSLLSAGAATWEDVPATSYAPEANLEVIVSDFGNRIDIDGKRFTHSGQVTIGYHYQVEPPGRTYQPHDW